MICVNRGLRGGERKQAGEQPPSWWEMITGWGWLGEPRDQGERETELEKISQVGEDEHVAEMSSSKMQWAQQACLSFIHASLVPRCSKSESSLALPEVLDVRTPF